MKRRNFLQAVGAAGMMTSSDPASFFLDSIGLVEAPNLSLVEARYYRKHEDREIECRLCPRNCRLGDRERGYCGVRENQAGVYYTLVYGKACAVHIDPVEKKPFFHVLPGSRTYSLAAAGCNVNCKFCQNWEISQVRPEQIRHIDLHPDKVSQSALSSNCPIIAYTYTEPVVFFEYMIDTARKAAAQGIRNVVVTGGHINPEPLQELLQTVDAVKIDLKAFSQQFYSEYVRGELAPVLDAIKTVAESPVWLEIVYLVIPGLNDSETELRSLCRWLARDIRTDVPIHFSRFHPMYLLKNIPSTPVSSLEKACRIAEQEGLEYAYIGNVPGHPKENTTCPRCSKQIIHRQGYRIRTVDLKKGQCAQCGHTIPGIWI